MDDDSRLRAQSRQLWRVASLGDRLVIALQAEASLGHAVSPEVLEAAAELRAGNDELLRLGRELDLALALALPGRKGGPSGDAEY